jgi:hypothetical protein
MDHAIFDALRDRIRLGADGSLEAVLGHVLGNDLTPEQFETLLAIPGIQYLTQSRGDSD